MEVQEGNSNNVETNGQSDEQGEKTVKLARLPVSRIKSIMKMDPDVHLASQESAFLLAKATELFLDSLAREAYYHTSRAKRKTLQKKDIDMCIDNIDCLGFLEGALEI